MSDFKEWLIKYELLEVSNNIYKYAEELGSIPREEVQRWLLMRNETDPKKDSFGDYKQRRTFTALFGWSVPCKEAVDAIKKYVREPLYDIMAGTGYWGRVLRKAGIRVLTSDIHNQRQKNYYHQTNGDNDAMFDPPFKVSPEKSKIRRRNSIRIGHDMNKGRIKGDIFLSWPPYQSSAATQVLRMIPIGTRVFYIGEPEGGCTGDLSLCRMLDKNFKELHFEPLPRFSGIHDHLYIYEKTKDDELDKIGIKNEI